MKCESCGGALGADMNFCPFCGVRAEIDLKSIHFRDLGPQPDLPCPDCHTPMNATEFGSDPKATIERCAECHGLFFNPGELEMLLASETAPLIWLDPKQLENFAVEKTIAKTWDDEIRYLKCPVCHERMSRKNFGRQSGVILDYCGAHGFWVQNGEFRRIAEWWRAGGKHIHQAEEQRRAENLLKPREFRSYLSPGTGTSIEPEDDDNNPVLALAAILLGLALKALR